MKKQEEGTAQLDDLRFGVKEVVMLIGWVLSMAGMYYTMSAKIEALETKVGNHNLELLEYKLNDLNAKTDRVINLLNANGAE